MFGYTDFIHRQAVQQKKRKEHLLMDNFEGENMKIFEIKTKWMSELRKRFSQSDSQTWALFSVPALCVATDVLGYPRMPRLKLSLV